MAKQDETSGRHWDAYWSTKDTDRAAVTGDAPGDLFDESWRGFLDDCAEIHAAPAFIDLACGAGVILKRALETPSLTARLYCGLDYSEAAARALRGSYGVAAGTTCGVVASADHLPIAARSFDIVASQFGLEYAGIEAFPEAARILSDKGRGQFIVHYKQGGIYQECADNFRILSAIIDADIIGCGRDLLGPDPMAAEKALATKVSGLRAESNGPERSARITFERLARDLARIAMRRQAFDPAEILTWLSAIEHEVLAFRDRMQSMLNAALDEAQARNAIGLMEAQGVTVEPLKALTPEGATVPAAWLFRFHR